MKNASLFVFNDTPKTMSKNMTVKLTLLDRKATIYYAVDTPVAVFDGHYRIIGTCKLVRDESGNHFGELDLEEVVNPEFFFYYRGRSNEGGVFIFSGLDFMNNEDPHNPTTKLKDMIVG